MFERRPGYAVLTAAIVSTILSTILSVFWPKKINFGSSSGLPMEKISGKLAGFVWLYCIIWWIITDLCKIGTYKIIKMIKIQAGY